MSKVFAKKRFGQNFLVDQRVLQQITSCLNLSKADHLVEIGPGRGALTNLMLPLVDHCDAIEIDRDLTALLRKKFNEDTLSLHEADILKFNFNQIYQDNKLMRVVGNLPYNISTELLFRMIPIKVNIKDMHFMLQKEVVERLSAAPGGKSYGRLTVLMQYYFDISPLFNIAANAFNPQPKVESAFVRLTPIHQPQIKINSHENLKKVVSVAFQQRRKTLRNALKSLFTAEELIEQGINPSLRPEKLSVEHYVTLSNSLVIP